MTTGKWPTAQLSMLTSRIMVGIASAATHAYADTGVPMLRNQNIKPGHIDDRDILYINSDFERLHRNKRLRAGDVIVVRTGYPGVSAVIPERFDGAQCFTSLIVRPDIAKLDANFLCQFMNSSAGRRLSSAAEAGGAQKNLNAGALEAMVLPVPPLADQHRIAQILTTWDEAITTAERLLELSQSERELTVQTLLSGRLRRGSFPAWRATRLNQLIRESRVVGSGGDRAQKLTVKLYGRGVVAKGVKRVGSESTQYYCRSAGQFIYSKLDFLNGAFGLIPPELDGYESTLDLPAFDFLPGVEPRWFLQHVSREAFYQDHLGLANGGRKARRVNPVDLLRISIDLPCLAEQRAIAEAVDLSINVVQSRRRLVGLLKTEKTALMTGLLTGKHHVRQHDAGATP